MRSRVNPFVTGLMEGCQRISMPCKKLIAGMAVAIFGTIILSNLLSQAMAGIVPMRLAPSILLVALLRHPPRSWPAFLLAGAGAAIAANLASGEPLREATMQAALDTAGPWIIAATLSQLRDTQPWFTSKCWIARFTLATLSVSTLAASIAAGWWAAFEGASFPQVWQESLVSNSPGYVTGTLFLLGWTEPVFRDAITLRRLFETMLLAGLVAAASFGLFASSLPLLFMVYPVLALATLRGRLSGATAGMLVISAFAIWSMVKGVGPIASLTHLSVFQRTLLLQAYLLTAVFSTIPIAVLVTLRDNFTEKLRRQDAISSAALDNMAQGLCMFGSDHRLIICNRRYAEMYNLPDQLTVPGTPGLELLRYQKETGFDPIRTQDFVEDVQSDVNHLRSHSEFELPDGRIFDVQRRSLPDGGWVSTHEDVTESRRAVQRIAYLANHDPLTGLRNRACFRDQLQRSISRAERGHAFALHCLDLDRFKAVNDTMGHGAGDELLKQVSNRLREAVRSSDLVTRLGGDEFAIIQYPLDRPEEAGELAGRIVELLGKPYSISGQEAVIGVSVGIGLAPSDAIESADLLQKSDLALYRAKTDGRNTFCFFEAGMDSALHERRVMETELRAAVQKGEFELYFQPVMDIETGAIIGFEALLRWRHPIRGLIEPNLFIPLAEETGLIMPIGEWAIRHACREAANWPEAIKVAVNISPVQFRNRNLANLVISAVTAAQIAPERLELEITESVLLQESEDVLDILHQIHNAGIGIAMDDFGTGYSSLGYLRSFPFDRIKIDGSFVRDIASKDDCLAIVHATAQLSRKLGMRTTAEGVETAEQLAILRNEGCTDIQGYYISEPVPALNVRDLLSRECRSDVEIAESPQPRITRRA